MKLLNIGTMGLSLLLSLLWCPVLGQKKPQPLLLSYENVTLDSAHRRVYYEQRLYRNPLVGMLDLARSLRSEGVTEFVPMVQGVPVARYDLGPELQAVLLSRQDRAAFARSHPFAGNRYKFDFRLQPEFIANFGNKDRPVESKTNLLVQSQLFLSRGLVLHWGVLVPIANTFDSQPLNLRPAPIYLNQFLALNQTNYLSLSAGLFYNDQYGVNVQYRKANLTKPWSFGVEAGLTGFYFFPPNGLYYSRLREVLLLADVAYRFDARDVTIRLSGGQYLGDDRGARVDFIRQFPNVEVGLFVMKTTNGSTGGFQFAIPIPPGKIAQSARLRLRTTEEFRWEYNYSRGYNIGTRYRVGNQLDALLRQYHQGYLRNQYRLFGAN